MIIDWDEQVDWLPKTMATVLQTACDWQHRRKRFRACWAKNRTWCHAELNSQSIDWLCLQTMYTRRQTPHAQTATQHNTRSQSVLRHPRIFPLSTVRKVHQPFGIIIVDYLPGNLYFIIDMIWNHVRCLTTVKSVSKVKSKANISATTT